MLKLIDLLLWSLFIITTLPASNARIFIIGLHNKDRESTSHNLKTVRSKHRPQTQSNHHLVQNIIGLLSPNYGENSENKCLRLFGSIYGTKAQRQECQERLRNKKTTIQADDFKLYHPLQHFNSVQYDDIFYLDPAVDDPFLDMTRDETKEVDSDSDYTNYYYKPPQYIWNPHELRSKKKPDIYIITDTKSFHYPPDIPNYIHSDYTRTSDPEKYNKDSRKYLLKSPLALMSKRNMNIESDEYNDYSRSQEIRKPKRFQIIDNMKRKPQPKKRQPKFIKQKYDALSTSSSEEKVVKTQTIETSSEEEELEPIKIIKTTTPTREVKKKKVKEPRSTKKEYYLQGGKIISSDQDFRRRLNPFLPKRYHWEENDVLNLGHYWFNGPQGRYPQYALRP